MSPAARSRGTQRSTLADRGEIPGMDAVAAHTVYPHVFANADREVGGVLIGRIARSEGVPLVTGAIPALRADEQRATLTFTQEAWAHVHDVLDHDFPADEQIVGWYHSHPGFGIFLSEHDLFIHRHFFSGNSQIALVVDPLRATEGVFAWSRGEITQLFDRPTPRGWSAPAAQWRSGVSPSIQATRRRPVRTHAVAVALVVAALLGLAAGFGLWAAELRAPDQTYTSITFPQTDTSAPADAPQATVPAGSTSQTTRSQ